MRHISCNLFINCEVTEKQHLENPKLIINILLLTDCLLQVCHTRFWPTWSQCTASTHVSSLPSSTSFLVHLGMLILVSIIFYYIITYALHALM